MQGGKDSWVQGGAEDLIGLLLFVIFFTLSSLVRELTHEKGQSTAGLEGRLIGEPESEYCTMPGLVWGRLAGEWALCANSCYFSWCFSWNPVFWSPLTIWETFLFCFQMKAKKFPSFQGYRKKKAWKYESQRLKNKKANKKNTHFIYLNLMGVFEVGRGMTHGFWMLVVDNIGALISAGVCRCYYNAHNSY